MGYFSELYPYFQSLSCPSIVWRTIKDTIKTVVVAKMKLGQRPASQTTAVKSYFTVFLICTYFDYISLLIPLYHK